VFRGGIRKQCLSSRLCYWNHAHPWLNNKQCLSSGFVTGTSRPSRGVRPDFPPNVPQVHTSRWTILEVAEDCDGDGMTYSEAYDTIGSYCNSALPYFADGWSRWPTGRTALHLSHKLRNSAVSWDRLGPRIAGELRAVADEVDRRANT